MLVGTFTEIDPPKRLAYRLRTEPMEGIETPPPVTTQVDFKDLGDRTEVCVTVTGLASSDLKDIISDGWKAAYGKLANLLKGTSQPVG